jgi:cytochrome c2
LIEIPEGPAGGDTAEEAIDLGTLLGSPDISKGRRKAQQKCRIRHTLRKAENSIGLNLFGILGTARAQVAGLTIPRR